MEGNKCEHPPSEPTRETETAKGKPEPTRETETAKGKPEPTRETETAKEKPEPTRETETAKEKKGLNWAAGSFALNLWRTMRDWWNNSE
ncbi:hypothetical protein JIX56_24165 [Streptomyces sp. CA-210063]|uniref:hypothetical protein n=1 Tax=Streptomyces sp. CA-210063 TaxID=2801029 RepID=UPI00214C7803|nr:hypothetical protein [Streptomyces sp. CA-210063]UUU32740.1 hypothetical protein JIX56_24165 [Streptomyces sp. CA-210063]